MKEQNKLKDSFLTFFHNLFDLMAANILWLLCSLPVITVGPATCGLYAVTLKLARSESVHPLRDFFVGFKSNFGPGVALGLICTVLPVVAAGDGWFALQQTGMVRNLYLVIAILLAVIWLILISYTFALQVMFDSPWRMQMLNAFKLAVIAPGKTVMIWLILLIPVLAALIMSPLVMKMLGFLYLVAGISGPVYWASHIQRNIFDRVNGASVSDAPPTTEE